MRIKNTKGVAFMHKRLIKGIVLLSSTVLLAGCDSDLADEILDIANDFINTEEVAQQPDQSTDSSYIVPDGEIAPADYSIPLSDGNDTLVGEDVVNLPVLDDTFYYEVNDNIPNFTNDDITDLTEWEHYSPLDGHGRVGQANANLHASMIPASESDREDISSIRPSGWNQNERGDEVAEIVPGGWLYNRSHLIGHQLVGNIEDDIAEDHHIVNEDFDSVGELKQRILLTGTRWLNAGDGQGMVAFENFVADYIETNEDHHVRYRVTPVFYDTEQLARGIQMEGFSIEDNGEGVQFNVYIPNIQPGVAIDYQTGLAKVLTE